MTTRSRLARLICDYRASICLMMRTLTIHQTLPRILFLSVFLLLFLAKSDYIHWVCPFYAVTHLPCPGCGMTRAFLALLEADWTAVVRQNLFAPYFALLGCLCVPSAFFTRRLRRKWSLLLFRIERKTGFHALCLLLFVLFAFSRVIGAVFLYMK